jgi:hypothetical protein
MEESPLEIMKKVQEASITEIMEWRRSHLSSKDLLCRVTEVIEKNTKIILNRIDLNESKIMALEQTLDAQITDLTTEVTNETTVEKSALTLIQGIPALIAAAIAKASAAGATTAQLQALSDLQTTLAANDTELSAAVTANTPAAS